MSLDLRTLTARPVADCTAGDVAAALTRAFEGYIVPLRFTPQAYERRFRSEDLDPYASRVWLRDGEPVGVLLLTRRGWRSRVAGMGFAPEVRNQGLGRQALLETIREAKERRERTLFLEVFEQNAPAVRLYTGLGFQPMRRLVGYRREAGETVEGTDRLVEIDPLDFARAVARDGEPGLPWMLTSETLSSISWPARAYRLEEHAYGLIADPAAEKIVLTALVVPREIRRQGWGTRLLRALDAAFPGRPWSIPPIVPEELAPGFFPSLGWGGWEINQLEMRLELVR
ncbi:MAG TPA: GNAT family N-acetyltransferase [Thermoanaerobaculia bacterium]|nr:GNAT family N-acetyltransferase [Thermoanaerobaculia bacterium]